MRITQAVVREFLSYDHKTGDLRWKRRDGSWFESERACKRWNTRYSGKRAFTYLARGRRWGSILNQNVLAHRIVWLWVTGKQPVALGFKNGRATDLRFSNLIEHSSAAAVREWRRTRRASPRRRRIRLQSERRLGATS